MTEQSLIRRIATRVERPLRQGDEAVVKWACRLAGRTGAAVQAMAYETDVLSAADLAADHSFGAARDHLATLAEQTGVRLAAHDRASYAEGIGESFASLAQLCDIAVLGVPKSPDAAFRMIASSAIFDGGPTIFVPVEADPQHEPTRIIVGWKPGAPASRALKAAIAFAGPAALLSIVQVQEPEPSSAEPSGVEATHFAAAHGVKAEFHSISAKGRSAYHALIGMADELGADMLAAGAIRHGPLHRALFGSVTSAVLDAEFDRPTLLAG
jgi:nucleotide-binding universal stress UspA family protein